MPSEPALKEHFAASGNRPRSRLCRSEFCLGIRTRVGNLTSDVCAYARAADIQEQTAKVMIDVESSVASPGLHAVNNQ